MTDSIYGVASNPAFNTMPTQIFKATISADGKLLDGADLTEVCTGDTVQLTVDGNRMIGGEQSSTLLGKTQTFLHSSRKMKLASFQPQPNGTCLLSYKVVS